MKVRLFGVVQDENVRTFVHPGIEVHNAIFPGSWASTFQYSRSFREHLGAIGSTSIDL